MIAAKVLQLLWAGFLAVFLIPVVFHVQTDGSIASASLATIFLLSAIGCVKDVRICWILSILSCISVFALWIPFFAVNTWMALIGHELYRDSPATFGIVIMYAIMFVLPPFAIIACLVMDWKRFATVFLRNTNVQEDSRKIKNEFRDQ